jgi:alpha-acetolactate decarboxylase
VKTGKENALLLQPVNFKIGDRNKEQRKQVCQMHVNGKFTYMHHRLYEQQKGEYNPYRCRHKVGANKGCYQSKNYISQRN